MKKFFISFIIVFLAFGFIIGFGACNGTIDTSNHGISTLPSYSKADEEIEVPKMTVYYNGQLPYIDTFYYAVDEKTGVVYLMCEGHNGRQGITVAYNEDGTVMTKDQIAK